MKLLWLSIAAILLASAFAMQARAESAISLIATNRQPAVITGFVTPAPHGSDPGRRNSSDFTPAFTEPATEPLPLWNGANALSGPGIGRVWSR